MDPIPVLRNDEEAFAAFEAGDLSLPEFECEVRGVLRTLATEFGEAEAYRTTGNPPADGLVVLADSPAAAQDRVAELVGPDMRFEVERPTD